MEAGKWVGVDCLVVQCGGVADGGGGGRIFGD